MTLNGELRQMTEMYETCSQDIYAHRSRLEELAQHVEELVSQLRSECTAREHAEAERKRLAEIHTTATLQSETEGMKRDIERLESEDKIRVGLERDQRTLIAQESQYRDQSLRGILYS